MARSDDFHQHERRLMALAYRLLGSSADAEDAVQETWLRWQSADHAAIADARAWLSTALVRLCVDRLTSSRARRETYPGTWLPEPAVTSSPIDVESISLGFLLLLERLSPTERAVFLLHRVFDYTHREIAGVLGINEVQSRQLLHRASEHMLAGRRRFDSDRASHERLLRSFVSAVSSGDVEAMSRVLAEDATLYGDGGGKVPGAILRPITGSHRVARFFSGLLSKGLAPQDLVIDVKDVNGWPAVIGRTAAGVYFVMSFETDGRHICTIFNVVNPEKLSLLHVD